MHTRIKVKDRKEARLIRAGLEDRDTRALVQVMGALHGHTPAFKRRVLTFVKAHFDEKDADGPARL